MTHSVSVVIPTYNRSRLIVRAIDSVFAQAVAPREVIVVDDGSTDDTLESLRRFGDRIRVVRQQNAGGAAARNRGIDLALSNWVAFLDSDDVWTPAHLERLSTAIVATDGAADLYFDDMEHETPAGPESRWGRAALSVQGPYLLIEDATPWAMLEHQPMMLQTSVVRRSRLLDVGGFWERLRTAHDTHLFFKICIGRPACAVPGTGAVQTDDDTPSNRLTIRSGPVKLGRWRNSAALHEDILERHPELPVQYRELLRRRIIGAHWRLSRLSWQNREYGESLRNALLSLKEGPAVLLASCADRRRVTSAGTRGGNRG